MKVLQIRKWFLFLLCKINFCHNGYYFTHVVQQPQHWHLPCLYGWYRMQIGLLDIWICTEGVTSILQITCYETLGPLLHFCIHVLQAIKTRGGEGVGTRLIHIIVFMWVITFSMNPQWLRANPELLPSIPHSLLTTQTMRRLSQLTRHHLSRHSLHALEEGVQQLQGTLCTMGRRDPGGTLMYTLRTLTSNTQILRVVSVGTYRSIVSLRVRDCQVVYLFSRDTQLL